MTMPQVGGQGPNALRKERIQCRASNEGLTAILELRTSRGLSKAGALRFTISRVCLSTSLPRLCTIELVDEARLIQDNSLVDDTAVVVSGTWTKPPSNGTSYH